MPDPEPNADVDVLPKTLTVKTDHAEIINADID